MKKLLEERRIFIFVEHLFDEMEVFYPRYRLIEEGARVFIVGPKAKEIYAGKHGYPCRVDRAFEEVRVDECDLLIIPGGYAPDKIRRYPLAIEFVRDMHRQGKWVAFICHGGWVAASAGVLKGVRCTSFFSIQDDMVNAGAHWVDQPVVVDQHVISSRTPDDLPHFCRAMMEALASVQHPILN